MLVFIIQKVLVQFPQMQVFTVGLVNVSVSTRAGFFSLSEASSFGSVFQTEE